MRRPAAALGSAVFFALAPGTVTALVPWLITRWRVGQEFPGAVRVFGLLLIVAGVPVLVQAFVRFVVEGLGTPAPVAPPSRLVVGGVYRFVRNPMYVAVLAAILGQWLLLGQWALAGYLGMVFVAVFGFVKLYEQPDLRERFGESYVEYCRHVPGWIPRLTPWDQSDLAQRK